MPCDLLNCVIRAITQICDDLNVSNAWGDDNTITLSTDEGRFICDIWIIDNIIHITNNYLTPAIDLSNPDSIDLMVKAVLESHKM